MNVINYSKTKFLFETIVREKFITVFKERWLIESGSEWKSNLAYAGFLKSQLKPNINIENIVIHKKQISILDNGNLYGFTFEILYTVLVHSKYKQLNNDKIKLQNQIIQSLYDLKLMIFTSNGMGDLLISPKEFKEITEQFYPLYVNLLNTMIPNGSTKIVTKKQVKNEIDKRITTTSKDGSDSGDLVNLDNEKKAMVIKEKGNKLYNDGKYNESRTCFLNALGLEGLSDWMKAILNLNASHLKEFFFIKCKK